MNEQRPICSILAPNRVQKLPFIKQLDGITLLRRLSIHLSQWQNHSDPPQCSGQLSNSSWWEEARSSPIVSFSDYISSHRNTKSTDGCGFDLWTAKCRLFPTFSFQLHHFCTICFALIPYSQLCKQFKHSSRSPFSKQFISEKLDIIALRNKNNNAHSYSLCFLRNSLHWILKKNNGNNKNSILWYSDLYAD